MKNLIFTFIFFTFSLAAQNGVAQAKATRISNQDFKSSVQELITSSTTSIDLMQGGTFQEDAFPKNTFIDGLIAKKKAMPDIKIRVRLNSELGETEILAQKEILQKAQINVSVGPEDKDISFIVGDQKVTIFEANNPQANELNGIWKSEESPLAHSLTTFMSQKTAYESDEVPVPPSRRFWIGYKRPDISAGDFVKALNEHLIPDTVKVGQERGLVAYSPVVIEGFNTFADLPSEFAIVSYQTEEKYRAIADTPAGSEYQASHWYFFTHQTDSGLKSGSAVANEYRSSLQFGNAYYLPQIPAESELQKGQQTYTILLRKDGETDESFIANTKIYLEKSQALKDRGLLDSVIRIEKNYVLEFQIWKSAASFQNSQGTLDELRNNAFKVYKSEPIGRQTYDNVSVSPGQGASFQFPTKILKPDVIEAPFRSTFLPYLSASKASLLGICRGATKQLN